MPEREREREKASRITGICLPLVVNGHTHFFLFYLVFPHLSFKLWVAFLREFVFLPVSCNSLLLFSFLTEDRTLQTFYFLHWRGRQHEKQPKVCMKQQARQAPSDATFCNSMITRGGESKKHYLFLHVGGLWWVLDPFGIHFFILSNVCFC